MKNIGYFIASVCFFLSALIGFFRSDRKYLPITEVCLGAATLILGLTQETEEDDDIPF